MLLDFLFRTNGDMNERVMTLIESMVPAVEIYSIDESFADLTGTRVAPVDEFAFHLWQNDIMFDVKLRVISKKEQKNK